MHCSNAFLGLLAISAATVNAQTGQTIQVTVGADGKLAYSPNNIVAPVGTQIEFSFFPKNHTVTQSSFGNPCHPLSSGGFFSSFVPTKDSPSDTTFTITVNDTKPIWFYCGQTVGNHCQAGMVGAINAPTTGNTFDAFVLLAKNASTSTSPPTGPVGGILKTNSNSTITSISTFVTTSAESTSYSVSTYTSASSTFTTTVASTTIFTTESSVVAAPTGGSSSGSSTASSSSATQSSAGVATDLSGNLFSAGAVILGLLAMF